MNLPEFTSKASLYPANEPYRMFATTNSQANRTSLNLVQMTLGIYVDGRFFVTAIQENSFALGDVTKESPLFVTKMSPYFDR